MDRVFSLRSNFYRTLEQAANLTDGFQLYVKLELAVSIINTTSFVASINVSNL